MRANTTLWLLGIALAVSACQSLVEVPRSPLPSAALTRNSVPTKGECDGLPALDLATTSDRVRCVALIDANLSFPRGVIEWNGDLIVADKVSNLVQRSLGSRIGRIYRYRKTTTGFTRTTLLSGLDNPSAIARGASPSDRHMVYIATPTEILRFDPDGKAPSATLEVVITDLPTRGWHYLTGVYTRPNELLVTVPSATDHCETAPSNGSTTDSAPAYPCPELASATPRQAVTAAIRRYAVRPNSTIEPQFELYARGLRDALALAFNTETGALLAADNGWDDIDLKSTTYTDREHPADEINLLRAQHHYGWPYCFGDGQLTPGYERHAIDCALYARPIRLLPAHSAPLAMLFFDQHLMVNLHGYREGGQRTVFFDLDEQGLPVGPAELLIDWSYPHLPDNSGGRPFGLTQYADRQIAITDDWSHALMLIKLQPLNPASERQGSGLGSVKSR